MAYDENTANKSDNNPFIYGPPVPPEKFIDREAEVDIILDRLSNPHNRGGSMVSGPSGIGKTSLLHYLCAEETREQWKLNPEVSHFIYMQTDLVVPFSEIKFWEYLFAEIKDWLGFIPGLEKISESLKQGMPPSRFDVSKFFTRLGIENKFVVVLLDGFDLLMQEINSHDTEAGITFLHMLRALLNLQSPRGFSLVTSSQSALIDLFENAGWSGSDFYNNMADLKLPSFQRTEIDTLVESYLRGTGIIFNEKDRNFLEETSLGHPKQLQQAAYLLFEKKISQNLPVKDIQEQEIPAKLGLNVNFTDFDVFLCHNSQDKPMVENIAIELTRRGLKPWLDKWHLPPGRRFAEEIEQVLPNIKSAAVFAGESGIGPWQEQEMYTVLDLFTKDKRSVIPVLLPGIQEEPNLPLFLRQFSWIRFNQLDDQEAIDNLIWGITGKHPRGDILLDELMQVISEACCLLIKTVQDVFKVEHVEPPEIIKQPDKLKVVLKKLEPTCQEFETNEIRSLIAQVKQHTDTRQMYLQEEEASVSPVAKPLLARERRAEEGTLRNIILSLKQRLEELTNQAIECGLE